MKTAEKRDINKGSVVVDRHQEFMAELRRDQRIVERLPVLAGPHSGHLLLGLFQVATRHPELSSDVGRLLQAMTDDLKEWTAHFYKESDNG